MARPTDYTPELAASICQALVEGTTLSEVLRWKSMPNRTTVYRWLHRHEDFRRRYTVALELAADELADKVVRIADNATPENASVTSLRMDAYPWRASKLAPKKYSDRAIIEDVTAVPVQDLPLMPEEISRALPAVGRNRTRTRRGGARGCQQRGSFESDTSFRATDAIRAVRDDHEMAKGHRWK